MDTSKGLVARLKRVVETVDVELLPEIVGILAGATAYAEARLVLDARSATIEPRLKPRDALLTCKEAGEILNVSRSWFRKRWDEFDMVQLSNGAYRIPKRAIDRYIKKHEVR